MIRSLIEKLICPNCGSLLKVSADASHEDNVSRGSLVCVHCPKEYLIRDGVPRFVQSDGYVDSFSIEWAKYSRTLFDSVSGTDESSYVFFTRTGLSTEEIKGKDVLDAGCGSGRFMEIVKKHGGRPIGLDLSLSVDQASENTGEPVIQADLLAIPFRAETFDIAFSWGVLHHTPDAKQSFLNMARTVKPGGIAAVWVYSNEGWKSKIYNLIAGTYRTVTTRLPKELLHKMCYVAIPLYYVHRIPIAGRLTRTLMPTSMNRHATWRVLDTFDWYSPKYQSKHTYREVESWFDEAGFTNIQRLPFPVSIKGVKKRT